MTIKLSLDVYDLPINPDLAIIIPFFNPTNSVRIIQNLLLVKHYLELSSIPFYICELAFLDYPHILPKADNILQLKSNSYMFYKENLINTIEKIIPHYFTKLCIMDADIIFENKNWYSIISSTLDNYDICQPFSQVRNLKCDFTTDIIKQNCIDKIISNQNIEGPEWKEIHIGYIWAFKRKWFKDNFTEDRTVIGGGDTFLFHTLLKENAFFNKKKDMNLYKPFFKFKNSESITMCNLSICHLFHGDSNKRQYYSRFTDLIDIFKKYNIGSIEDVLTRRSDNVLEWVNEYKPLLNNYMIKYFRNRDDDGVNTTTVVNNNLKFFPIKYAEPVNKDMAVVLCFFNPCKYIRIIQNILLVKNYMELSDIPFYISEIAFFNEPFLFKKNDNIFQYRSKSYLFYKENLNKTIEPLIPNKFTKLLLLDGDIFFDNSNWYSIISNNLEMVDILLPFKKANWLNLSYKIETERGNALDSNKIEINWQKEHVGFCLAVNRNIFKSIPVYETFITGGDTQIILYLKNNGNITDKQIDNYNMFFKYIPNAIYPILNIKYTYDSCNLNIYHLSHGTITNRKYHNIKLQVLDYFKNNNIKNIFDFLYRRADNILEINSNLLESANAMLLQYFISRHEDD